MKKEYAQQLLKETRKNYNQIAPQYSRSHQRPWPETEFLVDDYLMRGDRVLDLGCGNGRYFELMKDKDIDYFGVDSSQQFIEIARQRYSDYLEVKPHSSQARARFKVDDALNLSLPDNFFDQVYSIAVLHHIPSHQFRLRFLGQARRVLKPGGLLMLTVWKLWQKDWVKKIIYRFGWKKILGESKLDFKDIIINWRNCDFYFHCFTQSELVRLVGKVGFKVIDQGEFSGVRLLRPVKRAKELKTAAHPRQLEESKSKWPNLNFYLVAKK